MMDRTWLSCLLIEEIMTILDSVMIPEHSLNHEIRFNVSSPLLAVVTLDVKNHSEKFSRDQFP
jgi:hypothetical protein